MAATKARLFAAWMKWAEGLWRPCCGGGPYLAILRIA